MFKEYLEELKKLSDKALSKPEVERTYEDRFNIWLYDRTLNVDKQDFNEGEEVFIYDGKRLANNEIKDGFGNNFPTWLREIGDHFGEKIIMSDGNEYTLIGISYTYLDYYYLVKDDKENKAARSCVERIKFLG